MKKSAIILTVFLMFGCASSIMDARDDYGEMSVALRDISTLAAKDWVFASGMIQGALDSTMMPSWVFDELKMVDAWFVDGDNTELTSHQLGYINGLRMRLTGQLMRGAIEQYAPQLLGIREVAAVLSFIGL